MKGRKNTPLPTGQLVTPPRAPAHFSKTAKRYWKTFAGLLIKRRLLTDDDLAALTVLCTSFALYEDAQKSVDEHGAVIMGLKGEVKSPWVTIQNQAWDRIRPLLSEFGLTPCARAKFKSDDEDDDDFLDGGGANAGG